MNDSPSETIRLLNRLRTGHRRALAELLQPHRNRLRRRDFDRCRSRDSRTSEPIRIATIGPLNVDGRNYGYTRFPRRIDVGPRPPQGGGTGAVAGCSHDELSCAVAAVRIWSPFTRTLVFAGLPQVRESAVFSGIPITERLAEQGRTCNVCAIDLTTQPMIAFLRFETALQEVLL